MGERRFRSLVCAGAAFVASTAASLAETPANSSVLRIREAFTVDGIALLDSHSQHAARVGVCAASVFAGLKWCVTGTAEDPRCCLQLAGRLDQPFLRLRAQTVRRQFGQRKPADALGNDCPHGLNAMLANQPV